MLHPASQQSPPFMVDIHEQVGNTPPATWALVSLSVEQRGQGPDFLLSSCVQGAMISPASQVGKLRPRKGRAALGPRSGRVVELAALLRLPEGPLPFREWGRGTAGSAPS